LDRTPEFQRIRPQGQLVVKIIMRPEAMPEDVCAVERLKAMRWHTEDRPGQRGKIGHHAIAIKKERVVHVSSLPSSSLHPGAGWAQAPVFIMRLPPLAFYLPS